MNKIQWTRIQNQVGTETKIKLALISDFYLEKGISNFFNKTETLLEVGRNLNLSNKALFVTCFCFRNQKGLPAKSLRLHMSEAIPNPILGFKASGLYDLLLAINVELQVCMSIKEYYETNQINDLVSVAFIMNQTIALIRDAFPNINVVIMNDNTATMYQQDILPKHYLDFIWPVDFFPYQARHAILIARQNNMVSIQPEIVIYKNGESFYKQAFSRSESVIAYRVPKKY